MDIKTLVLFLITVLAVLLLKLLNEYLKKWYFSRHPNELTEIYNNSSDEPRYTIEDAVGLE